MTDTWTPAEPDELDHRYRALEAERLRPVPPPPKSNPSADFERRLASLERRLKAFGRRHHPEANPDDEEGGT